MNVKEVAKAMQTIEFVLFTLKNGDSLQEGEVQEAHQLAKKVMEKYLKPLGAFEEEDGQQIMEFDQEVNL